jgi:hypothetical protein
MVEDMFEVRGGRGGVVEPLGGAHSQLNRVAQQLNEWSSETLGFETRAERDLMWCCIDRLSRQAKSDIGDIAEHSVPR